MGLYLLTHPEYTTNSGGYDGPLNDVGKKQLLKDLVLPKDFDQAALTVITSEAQRCTETAGLILQKMLSDPNLAKISFCKDAGLTDQVDLTSRVDEKLLNDLHGSLLSGEKLVEDCYVLLITHRTHARLLFQEVGKEENSVISGTLYRLL